MVFQKEFILHVSDGVETETSLEANLGKDSRMVRFFSVVGNR